MRHITFGVGFFLTIVILSCQSEKKQDAAIAEASTELSVPLVQPEENANPDRDLSVGEIKEACQLISEKWLQQHIPGFDQGKIILVSRATPDNHASACECRVENKKYAFVIGYKKNPANLQAVSDLISKGQIKEMSANVPPFKEVKGLGQKAAFSNRNGNLVWVSENGVYIYMYIFPPSASTMEEHFNILYKLAPAINQKFLAQTE